MEFLYVSITINVVILAITLARYHYLISKARCAVVSYDEFEKVFKIAPNKYQRRYQEFLIQYDTDPSDDDSPAFNLRINSLFGYMKAVKLFKQRDKRNSNARSLENKQKLCKLWQKDVEEYKQNAIKDMTRQLRENSVAIFSEGQEAIIKAAVEQICKDIGQNEEAAKKAAEKAINTITIEAVTSG